FTYYEKNVPRDDDPSGLRVSEIELPRGTTKSDISFFVTRCGDKLHCKAEYASAILTEREAFGVVELYEQALALMSTRPQASVAELLESLTKGASQLRIGRFAPTDTEQPQATSQAQRQVAY